MVFGWIRRPPGRRRHRGLRRRHDAHRHGRLSPGLPDRRHRLRAPPSWCWRSAVELARPRLLAPRGTVVITAATIPSTKSGVMKGGSISARWSAVGSGPPCLAHARRASRPRPSCCGHCGAITNSGRAAQRRQDSQQHCVTAGQPAFPGRPHAQYPRRPQGSLPARNPGAGLRVHGLGGGFDRLCAASPAQDRGALRRRHARLAGTLAALVRSGDEPACSAGLSARATSPSCGGGARPRAPAA